MQIMVMKGFECRWERGSPPDTGTMQPVAESELNNSFGCLVLQQLLLRQWSCKALITVVTVKVCNCSVAKTGSRTGNKIYQ